MNAITPPGEAPYDHVLDTFRENEFVRFLELATFVCRCPVAAIRFTVSENKFFITGKNLPAFADDASFCALVLAQEEVLVTDARKEDRLRNSRLVTRKPSVVFFAGVPIVNTEGKKLGVLSVMDTSPVNGFTTDQKNALKTIAHLVACLVELKVNNTIAIRDADAKIEAEKKITRLTLSDQDSEREYLAHRLQENFAQTLAATKLFLEYAEHATEKKDHFIQKSIHNIAGVIDEISHLCRSIAPASLSNPDTTEILEDMVAEWQLKHDIYIDFICQADLKYLEEYKSLCLFHILQQQLKLATYCQAKKAEISILSKEGILIYFNIKDMNFNDPDRQKELFINNIYNRVALLGGTLSFDSNLSENDIMLIRLPEQEDDGKTGRKRLKAKSAKFV